MRGTESRIDANPDLFIAVQQAPVLHIYHDVNNVRVYVFELLILVPSPDFWVNTKIHARLHRETDSNRQWRDIVVTATV